MLISIETHITCDFSGGRGVQSPYPPSGSSHDMGLSGENGCQHFSSGHQISFHCNLIFHISVNHSVAQW